MEYIIASIAIVTGVVNDDIRYFYVAAVCSLIFTVMAFIKDIVKIKEGKK